MLVMAAATSGAPFAQCSAIGNGTVVNSATTAVLTYGQLAAGAALLVPPPNPALTRTPICA